MAKKKRHPVSIAFDDWVATTDGTTASAGSASGTFLTNRLRSAFEAGWHAAETKVSEEINSIEERQAKKDPASELLKIERRKQRDAELEELELSAQESDGPHDSYNDDVAAIRNRYKDLDE